MIGDREKRENLWPESGNFFKREREREERERERIKTQKCEKKRMRSGSGASLFIAELLLNCPREVPSIT